MKKALYIVLGIIIISAFQVNAKCTDYLECVTTKDTVAVTNGIKSYNLKKGTEFKICHQAGAESIVILADGSQASWVNDYKMKEKFDIKKAHLVKNKTIQLDINEHEVYSDPSASTIIGNIAGSSIVKASFYYGPYVFVSDGSIEGWIYQECIDGEIGLCVDESEVPYDDEEIDATDTIDEDGTIGSDVEIIDEEEPSNNSTMWIIIGSVVSVLIIGFIITMIIIKKKRKKVVS